MMKSAIELLALIHAVAVIASLAADPLDEFDDPAFGLPAAAEQAAAEPPADRPAPAVHLSQEALALMQPGTQNGIRLTLPPQALAPSPQKRRVIIAGPEWCEPCKPVKERFPAGDDHPMLTIEHSTKQFTSCPQYPAAWDVPTKSWHVEHALDSYDSLLASINQANEHHGQPLFAVAQDEPLRSGTIPRQYVEWLLDLTALPGPLTFPNKAFSIHEGTYAAHFPERMAAMSNGIMPRQISFDRKPRVGLGVGLIPLSGIHVDERRCVFQLDGWWDLTLEIQ